MASEASAARVYMDAILTQNRSLSRRGFYVIVAILVFYNLLAMGFLLMIGAFPVPIFLGLDVVGLLVAFRIHDLRARRAERVHVTADRVQVSRRGTQGGEHTVWTSPTAFTRVVVENLGEREAQVRLRLSNRALSVGAGLNSCERSRFAEALERAIRAARAERHAV